MHRTDAPGHVGNLHVDLNPPTAGTTVAAATMNASQEELCGMVEDLGIALVKGTNTQLKTALRALFGMSRPSIAHSIGGSALTVAIKSLKTGADAAAGSPIAFQFLDSADLNNTVPVEANLTGASSIVISSGSTMGAVSGVPFDLWLVIFKDGANLRPGLINAANGMGVFPLGQSGIASSTAEGGAGGADSANVFYTGTAVASKAYVILGRLRWESGLTAAGTWTAPTKVELFNPRLLTPIPFESAEVAVGGASTTTTAAHGLGVVPREVGVWLRNKTTEFGYAVGDEVRVYDGAGGGHTIFADSANIGIARSAGATLSVIDRGSFALTAITAGNWKLIFRAWKW